MSVKWVGMLGMLFLLLVMACQDDKSLFRNAECVCDGGSGGDAGASASSASSASSGGAGGAGSSSSGVGGAGSSSSGVGGAGASSSSSGEAGSAGASSSSSSSSSSAASSSSSSSASSSSGAMCTSQGSWIHCSPACPAHSTCEADGKCTSDCAAGGGSCAAYPNHPAFYRCKSTYLPGGDCISLPPDPKFIDPVYCCTE